MKDISRRALNGFSCSQGSCCLIWFRQLEFCASALPGSWGWLQNRSTRLHFYCKFPALRGKEDLLASSTVASGIKGTSPKKVLTELHAASAGQCQVIPTPSNWRSLGVGSHQQSPLGHAFSQHLEAGRCLTHSASFHLSFLTIDFPK